MGSTSSDAAASDKWSAQQTATVSQVRNEDSQDILGPWAVGRAQKDETVAEADRFERLQTVVVELMCVMLSVFVGAGNFLTGGLAAAEATETKRIGSGVQGLKRRTRCLAVSMWLDREHGSSPKGQKQKSKMTERLEDELDIAGHRS